MSLDQVIDFAKTNDPTFITNFAHENGSFSFNVVPHEDRNERFHVYRLVHLDLNVEASQPKQEVTSKTPKDDPIDRDETTSDDNNSDSDTSDIDTSNDDSLLIDKNPTLLECTIYGHIHHLEISPYGNWYPKELGEPSNRMTFPSRNPERAAHLVQLHVPTTISRALNRIDKKLIDTFDEDTSRHVPKSGYNLLKLDPLTIKGQLVLHRKKWDQLKNAEGSSG